MQLFTKQFRSWIRCVAPVHSVLVSSSDNTVVERTSVET